MLFEVKKENFFPDKSIFDSIMMAAQELYQEKLSEQNLGKFEKELKKKYQDLVKEGKLEK